MIYMWWFWWSYLLTACAEFSVVIIATVANMVIKRWSQKRIFQLTEFHSVENVRVDGMWVEMDGKNIVPGDYIRIQNGQTVSCDCILVKGTAIMNEASLTGESMPVSKVAVPRTEEDGKTSVENVHKRYKLFSGTQVLQAGTMKDELVYAIVLKTGISTERGQLISYILTPFNIVFRYDEEMALVFFILIGFGFCAVIALTFLWDNNGTYKHTTIKYASATFTVCQLLSPLLPLSLIVGQVASAKRLASELDVFCVNPKRIAICGKIELCCFDKTGTLTKEGLDFLGCRLLRDGELQADVGPTQNPLMLAAMATCHSCTKYEDRETGISKFVGNQVEVKMFSRMNAVMTTLPGHNTIIELPENQNRSFEILRRFEFDHGRMTMSVIVKERNRLMIYCKGAAEKIVECCDPSTVSPSFLPQAQKDALEGCYVLGVACRQLEIKEGELMKLSRDDVEQKLNLLGLIIFRNELKPDTKNAIALLNGGELGVVMITGDNAECGYYIGRECGMLRRNEYGDHLPCYIAGIDDEEIMWSRVDKDDVNVTTNKLPTSGVELIITGKSYELLRGRGEFEDIFSRIRIFARFSPTRKTEIIKKFVDKGQVVAMCGDGGNDCGALRAAHAGLALSEAEASVVSPFTSKTKSIMSMVDLLREGRCALATSFANYKFMIIFGLAYLITKLSYSYYDAALSNMAYLFIDVIIIICGNWALSLSRPLGHLPPDRPTDSLFGVDTGGTVAVCTIINWISMVIALRHMESADNYIRWPLKCTDGNNWWLFMDNWEAGTTMIIMFFQLFQAGFSMGLGMQYRQPVWRNPFLCVLTGTYWFMYLWILLHSEDGITRFFHFPSENFNVEYSGSTTWALYNGYHEAFHVACLSDNTWDPMTEGLKNESLNCEDLPDQKAFDPVADATDLEEWCAPGGLAQGYVDMCRCMGKPGCVCEEGGDRVQVYAMSPEHRFELFIIVLVNNLLTFLYVKFGSPFVTSLYESRQQKSQGGGIRGSYKEIEITNL